MAKTKWPNLQVLWLSIQLIILGENQIRDKGARELAKAKWPNLQYLYLGKQLIILERNKIGDEGARELSKANWPKLQVLYLSMQLFILESNPISPNAKLTIFVNFPKKCSIFIDETNVINKREEDAHNTMPNVMNERDKKDEANAQKEKCVIF